LALWALRERMKALADERRRFGYRRLHILLRREGYVVNHKRLFRLSKEKRLVVRRRGGRGRGGRGHRSPSRSTYADLGIDRHRVSEWREVRDAGAREKAAPADAKAPTTREHFGLRGRWTCISRL
jgi:hypothetical protein